MKEGKKHTIEGSKDAGYEVVVKAPARSRWLVLVFALFCLLQFQVKQPHNVEGGLVFLDSNRTKISNSNDSREGLVVEQMGLKKHQKEIYSNEPRLWIYVSALFLGITILGVDLIILLKQ